ncbi:hypothetical protein GXW82_23430 [Streptacidiphilus sp. 4-A2]|nr:hypothetical protein [Streptacidiphilus sp. 4-A2]
MINLLHSPLSMPADQPLTVLFYEHLELSTGVAYRAHVHRSGQQLGVIESCGNGESQFLPTDLANYDFQDFRDFVSSCLFKGEPTTDQQVHEALINECEVSLAIAVAAERGKLLAREVTDGFTTTLTTVPRAFHPNGHEQAAAQLAHLSHRAREMWTGYRWQRLPQTQPA